MFRGHLKTSSHLTPSDEARTSRTEGNRREVRDISIEQATYRTPITATHTHTRRTHTLVRVEPRSSRTYHSEAGNKYSNFPCRYSFYSGTPKSSFKGSRSGPFLSAPGVCLVQPIITKASQRNRTAILLWWWYIVLIGAIGESCWKRERERVQREACQPILVDLRTCIPLICIDSLSTLDIPSYRCWLHIELLQDNPLTSGCVIWLTALVVIHVRWESQQRELAALRQVWQVVPPINAPLCSLSGIPVPPTRLRWLKSGQCEKVTKRFQDMCHVILP